MSRARIEALALVNWKGVFYERYQFDRAVTALEGANGAGKTTVMIAAYIALFPEIAKLRFTNLGEHEATKGDRGIYGRLGREGWPSFTVLDLRYGRDERLLAGVKIERRNEPVVELEPFLVRGLGSDVRLQDVLLDVRLDGERSVDRLPDKTRLLQRIARAGGTLKWYEPRAYFREIFDLGVTPLRLDTEDERTRFNEMLRTSMVGGISRTLSGGLRDFVLREDASLAESLRAMRDNLQACQVTRREVEESSAAQKEISDVYRAAERMFTRAVHAARARAEEQAAAVETARTRQDDAERALRESNDACDKATAEAARAEEAERAGEAAARQAEDWRRRVERAAELVQRRGQAEAERDGRRVAEETARLAAVAAAEALRVARDAREAAVTERDRLSHALANASAAWAELSRRAGLHNEAIERLARLTERLGEELAPATFAARLAERREERDRLDAALVENARRVEGAEAARRDFAEVAAALAGVVDALAAVGETAAGPVPAEDVAARAEALDATLRELVALVGERDGLGKRFREVSQRAQRQAVLREALQALGVAPVSDALVAAAADTRGVREAATAACREAERGHEGARVRLAEARARISAVDDELPKWRATQALARELTEKLGVLPADVVGLGTKEDALRAEERRLLREAEALGEEAREHLAEADRLASSEGGLAPELVDACDVVEGELVVRRFDEVAIDDAAATEALLGPLRNGILVRDPAAAAARLLAAGELPEEVWLVDAVPAELPGDRHAEGVVVHTGGAVRVTRAQAHPVLGAEARKRRVGELRSLAAAAEARRLICFCAARGAAEAVAGLRSLAAQDARWLAPDPAIELERVRREAAGLDDQVIATREVLEQAIATARSADDRDARLAQLLPDARTLDGDAAAEREALGLRLRRATTVAPALERCRASADVLRRRLSVLRVMPPSVSEVAALRAHRRTLEADRDRAELEVRSLQWLVDNGEALAWTDAPARLRDAAAGEESLKHDHQRAVTKVGKADRECTVAEGAADEARSAATDARSALRAADEDVARAGRELAEVGVGEPGPADVEEARVAEQRAVEGYVAARSRREDARTLATRAEFAVETARTNNKAARELLERAEVQARPGVEAWSRLGAEVEARGFAPAVFAETVVAAVRGIASIQLSQAARGAQGELRVHLGHALRAGPVLAALEADTDDLRWEHYVRAWQAVREWVRQRVPANVSESDDPVTALDAFGRHLASLRATLERQESQLRSSSATVANHIGQSLKRASNLIQRLSSDLETVRFGSIRSIDVQARRLPHMNKLLDALRGEQAQGALFQSGLTLENALAAIYQRETGGRIAGERLLDYREYLELSVRVKREGSDTWEPANATRMSTGEAIGVGAALMMVVLKAWEKRDTLGRVARQHGSLRFLFLDEANRLSRDNLKTLFELCHTLELQLLVAAPEVDQSEGNITYRLVRRVVGEDAVVDVTGRRTEA
jgi:chromosome partition protein MukB